MASDSDYGPSLRPFVFKPASADGNVKMRAAYYLHGAGRMDQAAGVYRDILSGNPKDAEAQHLLGVIAFAQGKTGLAIQHLTTALANCQQPSSVYYANLGLALNASGQCDQAAQALRRACEMEPGHLDFSTKLAVVLLNAGRLEEAETAIQQSLRIQPRDMQAMEVERKIRQMRARNRAPEDTPGDEQAPGGSPAAGNSEYSVTISARSKQGSVSQMLREQFKSLPLGNIDSLFGFHYRCRLYGGRQYTSPEIDDDDLDWMYANSIGYRIPLTNKLATEEDYEYEKPFLAMHHRAGNSVIVVKDSLANWIRRDFPLYKIEASVIRETDTADKLLKALETFDTIVPMPEAFNTNYDLLQSFPPKIKNRIRLFLNAGCMYHCPRRICYLSFSRLNREEPGARFECSQDRLSYHFTQGMTDFPMQRYVEMGYHKFKLLRARGDAGCTGF